MKLSECACDDDTICQYHLNQYFQDPTKRKIIINYIKKLELNNICLSDGSAMVDQENQILKDKLKQIQEILNN